MKFLTSTVLILSLTTQTLACGNGECAPPPPPPEPPVVTESPERGGGGGSDLAGPLLLLGVIALIAIHNSKPRPITQQECLVEGKLDICPDPMN